MIMVRYVIKLPGVSLVAAGAMDKWKLGWRPKSV